MTTTRWWLRAACADSPDPRVLDAPPHVKLRPGDEERATELIAAFCDRCPVRQACGQDAELKRSTGVRGGELRRFEHGSVTAYNRHRRAGEDACVECLEAATAYAADRRDPIAPQQAGPLDDDAAVLA